jgi:ABC-type glycerol-3-phosphate transport system substrate-binding protein
MGVCQCFVKEETMKYSLMAMLLLVMGIGAGCAISNTASDLRGIKGVDGDKLTHINTRNFAVNLFVTRPMWGDASLNSTVQHFADEAKKHGATKVRIVQSDETVMWYFPPILGLIFTPVYSSVAGDALLP